MPNTIEILIVLGVLGVISPSTSSMIHNLSTMLFGALSTKSILNDEDIEVAGTN